MKKLLLFILFVGGLGYAYWPYHQTGQFRDALNADSPTQLEKMVDWPALRADVRDQTVAVIEKMTRERLGDRAASMVPTSKLKELMDKPLELSIIPANLPKMAKDREGQEPVKELSIESRSWVSPTEFTMTFSGDPDVMRFKVTGIDGWKLVGIQTDEKRIREALAKGAKGAVPAMGNLPQSLPQNLPSFTPLKPAVPPGYTSPLDARPRTERRAPQDAKQPLR